MTTLASLVTTQAPVVTFLSSSDYSGSPSSGTPNETYSTPSDYSSIPGDHSNTISDHFSTPSDHCSTPGDQSGMLRNQSGNPSDHFNIPADHSATLLDHPSTPLNHPITPLNHSSTPHTHSNTAFDNPTTWSDFSYIKSDHFDTPNVFFSTQAWPNMALRRQSSISWKQDFLLLFTFSAISQLPVDRFWIFFDVLISTSNFRNSGKIRNLPSLIRKEWEQIEDCSSKCKINNNHYHSYF